MPRQLGPGGTHAGAYRHMGPPDPKCGGTLSGKPVTAGTQRSSEEPHVDESRQGDNERACMPMHACIGMHKHNM